jgi:hypothetical protein
LEFGPEQSDARTIGVLEMRKVDHEARIDHEIDRFAVLGDAGFVAQGDVLRLPPGAKAYALRIG